MRKAGKAKGKGGKPEPARANGHGTLERRKNGWLGRWTSNGKRYSQTLKDENGELITDRRDAEQMLEKITAPYRLESEAAVARCLADRAAGKQAEIKAWHDKQPALSIAAAFDAYRVSTTRPRRAGEETIEGYERFYRAFVEWLKKNRPDYTELRQVTQADADAYAAHYIARHSGGSFNKVIVFFRCLWKTLAKDDKRKADTPKPGELPKAKLAVNPWEDIQKVVHQPHRHRELTVQELANVCGSVQGELRVLFALGVYLGLRLGDACQLSWGAVDLVRGFINDKPIKTAKHGTVVHIPIHPALRRILEETPAEDRTGYVLPGMAAKYKRDKSAPSKLVQKAFVAAGIKTSSGENSASKVAQVDVAYHSLRHSFVSMAGNAGASLAVVQSMVGHTSREMTQYYFHENDNALRHAVNLLPDVTGGGSGKGGDNAIDVEATVKADVGALADFRDIVERMTPDERKAATKWLADFNKRNPKT